MSIDERNTPRHVSKTYIVLGQEVERAEDLIILKLETLGSLKVSNVCIVGRSLGKLLGTSLSLELLLTVGILCRRDTRPAAWATVVVVRRVRVRLHSSGVVRSAVVEVWHDCNWGTGILIEGVERIACLKLGRLRLVGRSEVAGSV
jgi:hypothetical protein